MMTEFENEVASIVDPNGVLSLNEILKLVEEKFTSTNAEMAKLLCPNCHKTDVSKVEITYNRQCNNCDYKWKE